MGTITGQVRIVRGDSPPEPVMVTLQARGITVNSTYTDGEGRFVFYGLPSNLYHVLVNDSKYQPVEVQVTVHPSILPVAYVQISLDPKDLREEGKSPQAPASGGNPYLVSAADYTKDFPRKAVQEFEKAVKAEQAGKTDDAMRGYRKAIAIAPDFYPAHNQLGVAYLSRKDFPAAQAQFEEVLKLNQADANAYFNLGNVFLLTDRLDDALRLVEEGLRRQPNSGLGRFLLGSAYRRAGKLPEAERALHDAIAFDPTLSKAHLELVNLYLHQKRTPEAIAELKFFLKTFPTDPMAPQVSQVLSRVEGAPSQPASKNQ
jgi:tetratricopeptide (TPR) repeat protein